MKIILITLKKILFWSYERGSWQYDVMCVLILAFIFLSPNKFFQSRGESMPHGVRADKTGKFEPRRNSIDGRSTAEQFQRRKHIEHRKT